MNGNALTELKDGEVRNFTFNSQRKVFILSHVRNYAKFKFNVSGIGGTKKYTKSTGAPGIRLYEAAPVLSGKVRNFFEKQR